MRDLTVRSPPDHSQPIALLRAHPDDIPVHPSPDPQTRAQGTSLLCSKGTSELCSYNHVEALDGKLLYDYVDAIDASISNGPITGLAFAANLDTSLGDGDLLVFTPTATYAFSAPVDRDVWKDLNYPIQRFALLNFGSFNHESIVPVNGDLFFRAQDGIRSLIYARRDFTEWGNTPISRQMVRAIAYDTEFYLYAASAVNFDNRMLMTTQPQKVNGRGIVHRGMVALDFDMVSGMGRKLAPAWEGVWTGIDIFQMLTIRIQKADRCFVFGLNQDQIGLYEITKNGQFDFDGFDDVPIDWIVETRSMTFAEPGNKKRLMSAEQWYDQVMGQIQSEVSPTGKTRYSMVDTHPGRRTYGFRKDGSRFMING